MPRVTSLRPRSSTRVAVDLDGAPWRVLPVDVVVRAGLSDGLELDRARLRLLRRELRKAEAITTASRALRPRDLSTRRLTQKLEQARVPPAVLADSVRTLTQVGFLNDERMASNRARILAERNLSDAAIRHDLEEHQALDPVLVETILESLEPEIERAARIVASREDGAAAARYLARRGFSEETIEAVLSSRIAQDLGQA
ncbi:MAG: RecX family transcriptional regulator [Actinobacteria bacterium]|nr:RecX family transcriptional regulator [Actinomycetota bacterium]